MKRKYMGMILRTAILGTAMAMTAGAAETKNVIETENIGKKQEIHKVLKSGDVYENEVFKADTIEITVKEMITKVHTDGTYEAEPIGKLLDESAAYSSIEFKSDEGERLTVYLMDKTGAEREEEIDYIRSLSRGDVIWAHIEREFCCADLEEFVASNEDGSIITEHVNILLPEDE